MTRDLTPDDASATSRSADGTETPDELREVFGTRHLLRDLRTTTELISPSRSVSVTPLVDGLRDSCGAPALGALATVADVNASLIALVAAHPDWIATVALTLHAERPGTRSATGPIIADAQLERSGSKIVVLRVRLDDGQGATVDEILDRHRADHERPPHTRLATGVATFTRIPASASRAAGRFDPTATIGQRRRPSPDEPAVEIPLADCIGWRAIDPSAGVIELVATPYVQNSFGALTGGVHAMLMQAAAESAHPGMIATDMELHYLAQARGGRVRTRIERLWPDRVEVRLLDDDDVTITLGTVTLVHAP